MGMPAPTAGDQPVWLSRDEAKALADLLDAAGYGGLGNDVRRAIQASDEARAGSPSKEDIERAIAICEKGRQVHADWLEWETANPNWREETTVEQTLGEEHHRMWIDQYDHVLSVLRSAR